MKYFTIDPPPLLAPYVRAFWVLEGDASETSPYIYRGYADGCAELLFHYDGLFDEIVGDEVRGSYAAGLHAQTRKVTRFIVKRNFGIFGCYLFPFAIPKLFSYAASDLTDQTPDLATFLGREGRELEERIMLAGSNGARCSILASYLKQRLEKNRREIPSVSLSIRRMIDFHGLVNVRSLAKEQFMSDRTFERRFKEFSGFSPKLYSRIMRFQAVTKETAKDQSLTDIAYKYGYYDQSHFINDFREFTGYSPKAYFSGIAEGSEFLAD